MTLEKELFLSNAKLFDIYLHYLSHDTMYFIFWVCYDWDPSLFHLPMFSWEGAPHRPLELFHMPRIGAPNTRDPKKKQSSSKQDGNK